MVEAGGRDCILSRCAKQLRILCPYAIQTSVISLLNPEVGVSVDELDIWYSLQTFEEHYSKLHMWSVAFIIQTIYHKPCVLKRSVFPCLLYWFLVVFLFLVLLLGHLLCKHSGVLHSELQACIVINKTLENKYFGQGKKLIFCVDF